MDQFLALTIIGVIVAVAGIVMLYTKMRGGAVTLLIGLLWLFTMGIYYLFTYTNIYQTGLYPVANAIGIAILIIGLGAVLYYWMKLGVLKKR